MSIVTIPLATDSRPSSLVRRLILVRSRVEDKIDVLNIKLLGLAALEATE